MKTRLLLIIALILGSFAFNPVDADAAKRKSSTKTTQTTSSKKKSSKKSSSKSSSSKKSTSKKSSKSTTAKSSSTSSRTRRSSRSVSGNRRVTTPSVETEQQNATMTATTPSRANFESAADRAPAVSAKASDSRRKIKVEKPDLDAIRQMTLDPASKYYFPKLMEKYEKNDTTSMTPEDFRNFYLGYMFQEDFDPYRVSPYSKVTDDLRQKPTHTKAEIDTIIKYAQLALEDNPFDLRQMSFLIHVLKESKKNMRAKIWEYRLENLLGAIKSTGTGDSTENAWYVMYPAHEYDMVQLLGYEAVDAQFIDPGYDYLAVQPDESDKRRRDKSAKGFYFNVMVPQEQYELKHPEDMIADPDTEEAGAAIPDTQMPDPDEIPAE